jgi:hypothetical protein
VEYATNLQQLENLVLVMFTQDTMVDPKGGAHAGQDYMSSV